MFARAWQGFFVLRVDLYGNLPYIVNMERRTERIEFRPTPTEHENYRAAAASSGMRLSEWIRAVLGKELTRRRLNDRHFAAMKRKEK